MTTPTPDAAILTGRALECIGLTKSYGGVPVVREVNLSLEPGTVTALAGENGAGKSTIMKMVAGLVRPDSGTLKIRGTEVRHFDPITGRALGVAIIPQELAPILDMRVYENLYLGREPRTRFGSLNIDAMVEGTREILADFNLDVDPRASMRRLSTAAVQLIEIAKHTAFDVQVLLMDEPTSSLLDREVAQLFRVIERLRDRGVCIVYTTHKMAEIAAIADRVVVLRDGDLVGDAPLADYTEQDIVTAMIGRKIDDLFPRRIPVGSGEPLLQVRELTMRDAPEPVSLNVRPGEVVGLAGLVGAGRTELLEAIYGVRAAHGEVLVGGTRVRRGVPDAAIRHGMAMVPEERKSAGLLMQLSIEDNTGLPHLGDFTRFGVVNPKALHNAVAEAVQRVRLRFRDVSQPVATLSGGNQQKVVLARWLLGGMRILLLDEPTRGVDVGARAELYRIITGLAETGVAVLLASSDMDEVVNLSHRVLVLRDRRVAGVVDPTATDDAQVKERILRLAMGLTESDQLLTTGSKGSRPHPPSHEHGEHRP